MAVGVWVLNLAYGVDGTFTPLKDHEFVSSAFTGGNVSGVAGNRFAKSIFGDLPVPLPTQYLLGLDAQNRDFEEFAQSSYLRGEWKHGGWWYYYLCGLFVKVPLGTQILALSAAVIAILRQALSRFGDNQRCVNGRSHFRQLRMDIAVVTVPCVTLLLLGNC